MLRSFFKILLHCLLFLAFFGPNLHFGVDLTYAAGIVVILIASFYLHKVRIPVAVYGLILIIITSVLFTLFVNILKGGTLSESYMAFQYLKFGFFLLVAYGSHIILSAALRIKAEDQIMTSVNYIIISAIMTLLVGFLIGEIIYQNYVNLHLYQISIRNSDIILSRFTDLSIGGAAISLIYAVGLFSYFSFQRLQTLELPFIKTILVSSILIAAIFLTGRSGIVLAFVGGIYFLITNITNSKIILLGMANVFSFLLAIYFFGEYFLELLSFNPDLVLWVLEIFQLGEVSSFDVLIAGFNDIQLGSMSLFGSNEQILITDSGWRIDSLFLSALYSEGIIGLMILIFIMFFCFFFVNWHDRNFNVLGILLIVLLIIANIKEEFFGGVRGGMALIMFMLINCSSLAVQHRFR